MHIVYTILTNVLSKMFALQFRLYVCVFVSADYHEVSHSCSHTHINSHTPTHTHPYTHAHRAVLYLRALFDSVAPHTDKHNSTNKMVIIWGLHILYTHQLFAKYWTLNSQLNCRRRGWQIYSWIPCYFSRHVATFPIYCVLSISSVYTLLLRHYVIVTAPSPCLVI